MIEQLLKAKNSLDTYPSIGEAMAVENQLMTPCSEFQQDMAPRTASGVSNWIMNEIDKLPVHRCITNLLDIKKVLRNGHVMWGLVGDQESLFSEYVNLEHISKEKAHLYLSNFHHQCSLHLVSSNS